jgi:hypothetical protein
MPNRLHRRVYSEKGGRTRQTVCDIESTMEHKRGMTRVPIQCEEVEMREVEQIT